MTQRIFFWLIIISLFCVGCTQQQVDDIISQAKVTGQSVRQGISNFISNETVRDDTKISVATSIADVIKQHDLKKIENIQSYKQYIGMADNLNLVIDVINKKTGANIGEVSKEVDAWKKFSMEVTRYTPLINNYNGLLDSCYSYDENNEESVNKVLIKTSGFTAESLLIFGTAFYETAFLATGAIARATGITKLASLCGSCVSAAMSTGHWTIRNEIVERTTDVIEEGIDYGLNK